MNTERKQLLLVKLKNAKSPVTATSLAEEFGVTRQIIVSDVAILRAEGNDIVASRSGYALRSNEENRLIKTILCRHDRGSVLDEFYAVVDFGGKVLDVWVEHPLYGQIRAELNIACRYDAEQFVRDAEKYQAGQLCDLTGGLHLHTLSLPSEECFEKVKAKLVELGILAEKE